MATSKNTILYEVDVKTGKAKVTIGEVTKSFNSLGKAADYASKQTKQLSQATQEVTKRNAQMIDKTGLAGATVNRLMGSEEDIITEDNGI